MNKKWVASTAFASFLAAIGVSSTTSHANAAVSTNDKDTNNGDTEQDTNAENSVKDPTVASVMDAQGAPVTESSIAEAPSASTDTNTQDDTSAVQGRSTTPYGVNENNMPTDSTTAESGETDSAVEAFSATAPASDETATDSSSTAQAPSETQAQASEAQQAIASSPETNARQLPTNSGTVLERSATSDGSVTQAATNSQQDNFIAMAGPMAQKAAGEYNLYASVMMAQAILESGWGQSDLATDANNLFGIKGDYNGAYVSMPTSEWSADQGWYQIYANFRKYPSFYESFLDNGDKLRNGLQWNTSYYSGTWKENTSSYKDATAWLQGRYATAPNYASSLNNIIAQYNLTRFDTDTGSTDNGNSGSGDTNDGNVGVVNGVQTSVKDVAVVTNLDNAQIYDSAFIDRPSARALGYGTAWKVVSKVVDPSGNVFYQVSNSEYVLATDIQLQSEGGTETQPPQPIDDTLVVTSDAGAVVYSAANSNSPTSKILPYSSEWKTKAYILDEKGNKFFVVGKDAYVAAADVVQKSEMPDTDDSAEDVVVNYPDILRVTATPSAKLYNAKHNLLTMSLVNGTDWRTDKKSTHSDGSVWYRVSTDQWVNANDVQVLGSNYIKTVEGTVKINYIPGYGVNVYNSPAANNKFIGTRLADGTTWKVTSKQIVDGQTWYEVPAGWVNGKYCLFTPTN
ncbi:glucosaminidase domain-containing protein [Companilactobacillus mishanensis]|uniref:Mannosyl-glycoprotein endo-beta-N-acetylglucosamidase-like domain-containing protein n=1 Tax=Companilactobacillus mishanensis TaxID=2486008 RepID=A0ABW9P808_9LACO|nr:glucosaminidase domain-containing protein [Companilactobacillus mishanensis]MQS45234.1 hypothetical protein [Companilactobacillus mishanensis]